MKQVSPTELAQFLHIAKHRSFSKAAIELGTSASALSHALRGLEERLDIRLLNRTTRSVALTEAGERLLSRIAPAFRDIEDALEDLNQFRSKPSGSLRINAGRSATQHVLLPLVARFLLLYPEIKVEIDDDDALVDVVSSGFDAGVRLGERVEADMVAVRIGPPTRSAVVATADFLARHGTPAHPRDLTGLPCIRHRFPSGVMYRWEFERDGVKLETQVDGQLTMHDVRMMVDAALQGAGLAFVFEDMVAEHLASGRLIRVMQDWCPSYPGWYLYYPSRRQVPAALRAFIDFAKQ